MGRRTEYETLDGYRVIAATDKAVLAQHKRSMHKAWIPRSQLQDGSQVEQGDEDLCVSEWFTRQEGLA